MLQKLSILLFLIIYGPNISAQETQPNLDRFFSVLSENRQFNGNVLVAENGNILYEKSFGYADFSDRKLNSKKSTFPIASITKTFTATAILQLQEKGKLQVTDPVSEYLPAFPYPAITIVHLLSHTSGLQPYDNFFDSIRISDPGRVFTNRDILPAYAELKLPLFYQPGNDGNYDNVNYIFLALIVEKVSGMPLHDYLRKNILRPAGMKKTIFPEVMFYHYTPAEKKNLSLTYRYPHLYSDNLERTDTIQFVSDYWNSYNFEGFGEIISTTEDLLKYDQALYNGKLLSDKTLDIAFTQVLLNNGKVNPVSNGLGWQIERDSIFGKVVRHGGGMIGLRSGIYRNITKHQTIILIDNTQNETDILAKDVLKIINGQPVNPYAKSVAREFGKTLVTVGLDAANDTLEKLKKDTVNYSINEDQFNSLGYDFMGNSKLSEALVTFKINTQLFPESWNVYDSYGEALLKAGKKDEAINMYKKSIELNPENQNGKKVLEQLLK